jgi:hypothetical protein
MPLLHPKVEMMMAHSHDDGGAPLSPKTTTTWAVATRSSGAWLNLLDRQGTQIGNVGQQEQHTTVPVPSTSASGMLRCGSAYLASSEGDVISRHRKKQRTDLSHAKCHQQAEEPLCRRKWGGSQWKSGWMTLAPRIAHR